MSALGETVATIFAIGITCVTAGVPICFLAPNWNRFVLGASGIATGIIFLLVALLILAAGGAREAFGRDLDGRYANSALKPWFDQLKSAKGACCSDADGFALSDVDWESSGSLYRVRIEGEWWDVPEEAVITEPNRAGRTMVWPIYYRSLGARVRIEIRCFMPGSMT